MRRNHLAIWFFPLMFLAEFAVAADYPHRPIRFIVAYTAGGNTDVVARAVSEKLSRNLGQQIIVDNRGGAGGTIGTSIAAQAAPDGYTMIMGTAGTHAVNVTLFKKLPYHPLKDFSPVSLVAKAPLVLVSNLSFSPRSLNEFLATIRQSPAPITYGSSGIGTASHLAMALLIAKAGGKVTHVPYRGNSQAVTDLLGGQIPIMFMTSISALPLVKTGRLRALGVTSAERLSVAPVIPTIAETLPGFEASPWYGVFLPFGAPKAIVERLNNEILAVLQLPEIRAVVEGQGGTVVGNSPKEFEGYVRTEIEKWREAILVSGATVGD